MPPIRTLGIAALLAWTLIVTVLRAVRLPNDFAEAHWLVDYRFGFVKRGLVGTVVALVTGALGARPTERLVAVLSIVAFAVFCLMLAMMGWRVIRRSGGSTGALLAVLVFFSSPFIVMSAHLLGYPDNLIIMLAVISIALLLEGRPGTAVGVQAIAILVHESSLLVVFPVFCLAWLLVHERNESGEPRRPFWPLLVPLAVFFALAVGQSLFQPAGYEQSLGRHLSSFPFIQENRSALVPRWLNATYLAFYTAQSEHFAARLFSPAMFVLVLPSMLAVLCFTYAAYRIRKVSAVSFLVPFVCLLPQLMHVVAWDTCRIWTYSILCAFLALWIHAEVLAARRDAPPSVKILCLAALAGNILLVTPLMDGEVDRFTLPMRLLLSAPIFGAILALMIFPGRATKTRVTPHGPAR